jgi:hypothetical protein
MGDCRLSDAQRCNLTRVERRHVEQYWQRKAASSRLPRVRNEDLYAGSPMHYYCRHCGVPTETLPETHREAPKTVCDGCKFLCDHALMPPPVLP